jgi:hypothetical protein
MTTKPWRTSSHAASAEVLDDQRDLVRRVARLEPMAVLKG